MVMFANELNNRRGCVLTVALALGLAATFWAIPTITAPKVLRIETDVMPSSVVSCIDAPDGQRLFGPVLKIPIGNPLVVHRTNRAGYLYLTSGKQQIVLHRESGVTNVIVRAHAPLSQEQTTFLHSCSPGNW